MFDVVYCCLLLCVWSCVRDVLLVLMFILFIYIKIFFVCNVLLWLVVVLLK